MAIILTEALGPILYSELNPMSEDENVGFHFCFAPAKSLWDISILGKEKITQNEFYKSDFQTESVLPFISRSFEGNDGIESFFS